MVAQSFVIKKNMFLMMLSHFLGGLCFVKLLDVCLTVSNVDVCKKKKKPFSKFAAEKQEVWWKGLLPSYCSIVGLPDKQCRTFVN